MQAVDFCWDLPLDRGEDAASSTGCREIHGLSEAAVCDLCTASVEKRIREEQAWQLQKTLQDLIFRFQDWLWAAEATVTSANSSQVSYANSKKELQRFEALQRQLSDKLLLLETLNRRYRQLVRSVNISLRLRSTVQELNWRWDNLQTRAAAIYKRVKYFVNQWEEFELERETIQVWLMELDLRLTNVEHFSGGTSRDKIMQLQAFQEDVQANADRVDHLLVCGERLIQKSQPEDAEILEEELQELSCFCQEVFRRVYLFRRQLVSMRLVCTASPLLRKGSGRSGRASLEAIEKVSEDERLSDRESDLGSDCFTEESLEEFDRGDAGTPLSPVCPLCQSTPKKAPSLRRKRLAPNAGGAVDLEWDPSVDVGGSTSHDEEDSSYYSAITGVGQWEEPRQRCRSSSGWVSHSLPLRCGSQEDFSAQNGLRGEWEQLNCSGTAQKIKRYSSGNSYPWEMEHSQNLLSERGSCHTIEPTGFDPKRIETWLGQNCQKMGAQLETGQGTGTCAYIPQPTVELQFLVPSQTAGQRAKRQKPPQRTKKKARPTLVTRRGLVSNRQISKKKQPDSRSAEIAITIEKGYDPPQPLVFSVRSPTLPGVPTTLQKWLLFLFPVILLLLLLLCRPSWLSCLQASGYARSFHLTLKHSGPPPT